MARGNAALLGAATTASNHRRWLPITNATITCATNITAALVLALVRQITDAAIRLYCRTSPMLKIFCYRHAAITASALYQHRQRFRNQQTLPAFAVML